MKRRVQKLEKRKMTRKLSAALICVMILGMLCGCGEEEKDPYSSPSFSNGTRENGTESDSSETDASLTDALMLASYTDATITDASSSDAIPASLTDAMIMGLYQDNTYYNSLADFKITVDGNEWVLFDSAEVASATGATEDYVNNLWYGYRSPYDEDTTYAAIACHRATGSTIIVSYINPASYNMPDYSANEYLKMASAKYDDAAVRTVTFLGQKYECLDVHDVGSGIGRRTQFAIKRDGIIVLITFTMNEDIYLTDGVQLLSPLYY